MLATCDESLFWYYISERHHVWARKNALWPKPWTEDPILQKYKFVNVFRKLDRTTEWLIDNFLDPEDMGYGVDCEPEILAFNICWYRMFNRWETGRLLGWQESWDKEKVREKLNAATFPIFTGAYIIHSEPGESKLDSIVDVCGELYRGVTSPGFSKYIEGGGTSMFTVWKALQGPKHVGPFMAYQMVLDMMYTKLLDKATDRLTWTYTGPGALRGLKRLDPEATMRDSLARMLDLRDRCSAELERLDLQGRDGWLIPELNVHDIEFCLCELDKYCRVKFGEGRPRSTYPGL